MNIDRRSFLLGSLCVPLAIQATPSWGQDRAASTEPGPFFATGTQAAAATVHPLASQAARNAILQGGNAVDAIVAAAMMLTVVDSHNSGIGGGCFLLIRKSNGAIVAIDGRETAPQLASRDMFLREGKPNTELSQTGALAVAVPGLVSALSQAHTQLGRLPWKQLVAPAAHTAADGFPLGTAMANAIRSEAKDLSRFAPSAEVLLNANLEPKRAGEKIVQRDLAQTLTAIGENGPDWFYRGPFAEATVEYLSRLGGIMSQSDFQSYRAIERQAIRTNYRRWSVFGFPPPSSGGVHIAQMLGMLERFDLADLYRRTPHLFFHVIAEAMKLAFADRAHWLGDPDHARVPSGLLDSEYVAKLSQAIKLDQASPVAGHGTPPQADSAFFEDKKHTTHLTAIDADGTWVAMTATVNTSFGSKLIVPGTGVVLNNQMDDFSIAPGTANAFGLIGAANNAVGPGKRPLSSMSPTIVVDASNQPVLTCGAAGGPKIINATLLNVINVLDLGMTIDQSLAAPRIHHQWRPDKLLYESKLDASVVKELARLGHNVEESKALATAQGAQRLNTTQLRAASDPRTASQSVAVG
jgi:gamma-glutamyltranspeptidase / glutathione hydrolase